MKDTFLARNIKLGAIIALLTATGCAEQKRRILEGMPETGSDFTQTLAKEYEALGKTEQSIMYDEISADYFYRKAICAKEGYYVIPTPLEKWDIDKAKIPELAAARERLIRAIEAGAPEVAPKMTAYAQVHFDCWVEEQSEDWQKEDIAICRDEFYQAIAEVELMLKGGFQNVLPSNMVFFDGGSSHINPDMMPVLDQVASLAKAAKYQDHILLVGRTDQVGDSKHNKDLSKRRAMAVKEELIHRGIPSHVISIKAAGETPGPETDTHNRRVDILFLGQE